VNTLTPRPLFRKQASDRRRGRLEGAGLRSDPQFTRPYDRTLWHGGLQRYEADADRRRGHGAGSGRTRALTRLDPDIAALRRESQRDAVVVVGTSPSSLAALEAASAKHVRFAVAKHACSQVAEQEHAQRVSVLQATIGEARRASVVLALG